MTDISGIFSISSSTNPQWISLCGHLEAVIGNYLLSQAGNPEAYWYAIYYDSSVDGYNECVEITDKNLIGYVYCDDRVAFVLNSFLERFINDTVDYNIHCNGVQREHNKKLNNGLPILHKVPPKRDYGRYFCIMAEKGGTSHGGLTEKLSPFFHAKKQEVNAYGR